MRVLVIQGAGMELRGRENVEVFGPETLPEIDARIEAEAAALNVAVEIRQSNDEAEVAGWVAQAASEFDALIINPSAFTVTEGPLIGALRNSGLPVIEVHASNPAARGVRSNITPVSQGAVCGFGYDGYRVALAGLLEA